MKNIVILYNPFTDNLEGAQVILYDEIHDPVPFLKRILKNCDIYNEQLQFNLEHVKTVEEIECLIYCYNIQNVRVYVVDKINPKVDT